MKTHNIKRGVKSENKTKLSCKIILSKSKREREREMAITYYSHFDIKFDLNYI